MELADLTVNLTKSEIGHAQVTFLGHVVGGGMVKPLSAKVQVVTDHPPPANKKDSLSFFNKLVNDTVIMEKLRQNR